MRNSNREGNGVYFFKNGDVYMGEWKGDNFNGKGSYIFKSKREMYVGELKENRK